MCRISPLNASRALFLALVVTTPIPAQSVTTAAATTLHGTPGGASIGTLRARTPLVAGASRGAFTEVTISGYVKAALLEPARRPFNWKVEAPSGALVRASASTAGAVVAELADGAGLAQIAREGDWVKVSRTAWVRAAVLEKSRVARATPPVVPKSSDQPDSAPAYAAYRSSAAALVRAGALTAVRETALHDAPDGRSVARVAADAVMVPLARDRGWVRVRVEGWIAERDLAPVDSAASHRTAAADLRADPAGMQGRIVHWDVEFLSLQNADPLRKDLEADEPYLLMRGPLGENALLYVAVPPALLTAVRALPPLAPLTITARVRNGRSEPNGVPVLELQSLVRRRAR